MRAIALLSKRSGARQVRHVTHGRSVLAQYILERLIVSTGPALPRVLGKPHDSRGNVGAVHKSAVHRRIVVGNAQQPRGGRVV